MDLSKSVQLSELLKANNELKIEEIKDNLGDVEIRIKAEEIVNVLTALKSDSDLEFNMLLSVTAVDYMDTDFIERPDDRFEVVYHLLSLKNLFRLRVKVAVGEVKPEVPSVSSLWSSANFMEREVWDMFGINFAGSPDLRRILMYDEFKGHPLLKDYPLQAKQPRVKLRSPEVTNTARDMKRPALIQINKSRQSA